MPVKCSTFVELVVDCDLNPITPIGLDGRTRKCTVDNMHLMSYNQQDNRVNVQNPSGASVATSMVQS
jgi:hypothetical protein